MQAPLNVGAEEEEEDTGVPVHVPATHWSFTVLRLPSSHAIPSAGLFTHVPFCELHVSTVQMFLSSQFLGAPGVHTPFTYMSPVVQGFPSSQGPVGSVELEEATVAVELELWAHGGHGGQAGAGGHVGAGATVAGFGDPPPVPLPSEG
jgi:hypothetical protein